MSVTSTSAKPKPPFVVAKPWDITLEEFEARMGDVASRIVEGHEQAIRDILAPVRQSLEAREELERQRTAE